MARRDFLLEQFPLGYPQAGGAALLWSLPWPNNSELSLSQLDIWFIEVCRRIRLSHRSGAWFAESGTSQGKRIDADNFNGAVGDPWAPVHTLDRKALSLTKNGELDYNRVVELMFSGTWTPPLLATLGAGEDKDALNWMLIAQAFARGNSVSGGFKERLVPIACLTAKSLGPRNKELPQRRHSSLGYKSPAAFETAFNANGQTEKMALH